jgi:hypothetical protein
VVAKDRGRVRVGREPAFSLEGYRELLSDMKEHIRSAQVRAALSVNRDLIVLYRQIGRTISERQDWHQAAANLPWGHIVRLLDTVPRGTGGDSGRRGGGGVSAITRRLPATSGDLT